MIHTATVLQKVIFRRLIKVYQKIETVAESLDTLIALILYYKYFLRFTIRHPVFSPVYKRNQRLGVPAA